MTRFLFTCPRCAESVSPSESACPSCGYTRLTTLPRSRPSEVVKRKNGRAPGERKQLLRSEARAEYGITTTWEAPGTDLPPLTLVRRGKARAALRESASIALGESESYRLVAYSTPETIYTDLIGGRADALHPPRGFKATYSKPMPKALPEVQALGAAKLPRSLLHPRLERPTAH